jgi:hypothetical protein
MEKDFGFLTLITLLQFFLELFGQLFKNGKGTIKENQAPHFTQKVTGSDSSLETRDCRMFFPFKRQSA